MKNELEKLKDEFDKKFKKLNIPEIKLIDSTINGYFLDESTKYTWGFICEFETYKIDIAFSTDFGGSMLWDSYVITCDDTRLSTFYGTYHHSSGGDVFNCVDDIIQWLYNLRLVEVLCKEYATKLIVTKKENLLVTGGNLEHVKLMVGYNSQNIFNVSIHLFGKTVKIDLTKLLPIPEIINSINSEIGKTLFGITYVDKILDKMNDDLKALGLKVEAENYDLVLKDKDSKVIRRKSKLLLRRQTFHKIVKSFSADLIIFANIILAKLQLTFETVYILREDYSKQIRLMMLVNSCHRIDLIISSRVFGLGGTKIKKSRIGKSSNGLYQLKLTDRPRNGKDRTETYVLKLNDSKTIKELVDSLIDIFMEIHKISIS